MDNIVYGYIRVSSKDQNEDRQRIAIAASIWTSSRGRTLTVPVTGGF